MENKKICKQACLEIKQFDQDERTIAGYASTFGLPADTDGDVMAKGAFSASLQKINSGGVPLLDGHSHKSTDVLGTVYQAFEDDHGLFIKAKLAKTPAVDEVYEKLKQGHLNKFSVGFFIEDQEVKDMGGQVVREIKNADLIEVSVVPIPANSNANILSVKNIDSDVVAETEQTEGAESKHNELFNKYLHLKGKLYE
jgi:HK97 family phage prohead protease